MEQITLRAARVNADLTLDEAAAAAGITRQTLLSYEHGRSLPRIDIFNKLCEIYQCPMSSIIIPKQ